MQASLLFSLGLFVSLSHPCGYGGLVNQTSDLGSDASRRGVRASFIRTKEPFRRAPFSLPFGANKCKLFVYHRFAKVSANSLNRKPACPRQTRGARRSGAEKTGRATLLPSTFCNALFRCVYVVIILSCGRFVNQKNFNVMRQETFAILFLMRKGRPEKRTGAPSSHALRPEGSGKRSTLSAIAIETWNQHKERAMGTEQLAIQVNERLNDFRVKIIDIRASCWPGLSRPMRRRSSGATSTRPATR